MKSISFKSMKYIATENEQNSIPLNAVLIISKLLKQKFF